MFRGEIAKGLDHDPDFKWRGENVTRIENLSDIAFALALSMLVAGSGVPQTIADLKGFLYSMLPVAAAFATLFGIWKGHFTFFRRYGLNDGTIITLNTILIFLVLYMAYPLRFAFDSFFAFILIQFGRPEMMLSMGITKFEMSGVIIAYFAVAFAAAHFLFILMHRHALKKHQELDLTKNEITATRQEIFKYQVLTFLGVLVGFLAYFTPLKGFAGCLLFFTSAATRVARKRYPLITKSPA